MAWCYIAYGLAAFCAFVCAVMAYRRKTHLATVTGTMFLAACAANLTYLVRIGADTYFAASLTTSAYFVCLDFLVLSIVYYMVEFTRFKMERPRFKRVLIFTVYFLTFIDAAVLILNVFHEVILRYQHHADSIYAIKFMFEAKTGFYLHLAFVYLLVAMFFFYFDPQDFQCAENLQSQIYQHGFGALCDRAARHFLYGGDFEDAGGFGGTGLWVCLSVCLQKYFRLCFQRDVKHHPQDGVGVYGHADDSL